MTRKSAMTRNIRRFTLMLSLAACGNAYAVNSYIEANVTHLLYDSTFAGYCLARINVSVSNGGNQTLNCPDSDNLVSFSCDGTVYAKAVGAQMYGQAQLAFVTGKQIGMFVYDDPDKKIDGWCTAGRVDVLP